MVIIITTEKGRGLGDILEQVSISPGIKLKINCDVKTHV